MPSNYSTYVESSQHCMHWHRRLTRGHAPEFFKGDDQDGIYRSWFRGRWNMKKIISLEFDIHMSLSFWDTSIWNNHGDVIKMETYSALLALCAGGIHLSPVNSCYEDQWRGALMSYLICAWTNGWVNNRDAGELRSHRPHYDLTIMTLLCFFIRWKNKPVRSERNREDIATRLHNYSKSGQNGTRGQNGTPGV